MEYSICKLKLCIFYDVDFLILFFAPPFLFETCIIIYLLTD